MGALASVLVTPIAGLAGCSGLQLATCAGSSICSCLCSAVGRSIGGGGDQGVHLSRTARLSYLGLFLITTITAGVFRDVAPETFSSMDFISKNMECPADRATPTCMARAFVLRMCFAHAIFHGVLALATIGADDLSNVRSTLHTHFWMTKTVLWALAHVTTLFMPSAFFLDFGWIALTAGVFFLIVQVILYIDWIYAINEGWIDKDGTDNVTGPWHMLIAAISLFGFAVAITLTVLMYKYFGHPTGDTASDCGMYTFFTTFNLIMWIILTAMSFKATEWMPSTGLMPSAMVSAFMSFKVLMALYSQNQCNDLSQGQSVYKGPPQVMGAISIIIAVVLAAYNSVWISGSMEATANREKAIADAAAAPVEVIVLGKDATAEPSTAEKDRKYPLLSDVQLETVNSQHDVEANKEKDKGEQLKGPIGYNIACFHASFLMGMCYVAMQLTNWNEDFQKDHIDNSTASMWIKICDSWVLALAYGWSMVAPKVLSGRSFA